MSKPERPEPLSTRTEPAGAAGSTAYDVVGALKFVSGLTRETTRRACGVP